MAIYKVLVMIFGTNPFSLRRYTEPFRACSNVANLIAIDSLQHPRSEEHTSELQSLMRISYAVFCLKKKKTHYLPNHIRLTHRQHKPNITQISRKIHKTSRITDHTYDHS